MSVNRALPEKEISVIYEKLVNGLREYTRANGFKKIVVGVSGGVDSAVTCSIAAFAAGRENVLGIAMPSKYSSEESVTLARDLAANLGVEFRTIPIGGIYEAYLGTLEKHLGGNELSEVEIYHQNIQARIRGNIIMAFSNRYGFLVAATGNRSEAMMGYCTLYGDTVGGIAVIADLFKTDVYRLAAYINRSGEIIPAATVAKVPSAELKPGQKDEDSLPPYDILDQILYLMLDEKFALPEIKKMGFDGAVVDSVSEAVKRSAYKRKQCPSGIVLGDI